MKKKLSSKRLQEITDQVAAWEQDKRRDEGAVGHPLQDALHEETYDGATIAEFCSETGISERELEFWHSQTAKDAEDDIGAVHPDHQ